MIKDFDDVTETVGGSSHLNAASLLNGRVTPRANHEKNLRKGLGRCTSSLGVGTGDAEVVTGMLGEGTVDWVGELLIVDSDLASSAATTGKGETQ